MDVDQVRELLGGRLGRELLNVARRYVTPLYWHTPKEDGKRTIDNNGSAFILNAGANPILVTAGHVFEGYVAAHEQAIGAVCQVGGVIFPIVDRLIENGRRRGVDIATFHITEAEIAEIGKNVLTGYNAVWPPSEAAVGDAALLAGYPGRERRELGNQAADFGIYAGLTPVTLRSDRHFGCVLDHTYWHDVVGCGMPPEGYNLGGASGAPVLLVVESAAHVISWSLGGVLYTSSVELGEVLYVAHARFILPDGTLDVPPEQEIALPEEEIVFPDEN